MGSDSGQPKVEPPRPERSFGRGGSQDEPVDQAALSHIAVSKALLIIGMFMPKLVPAACLGTGLTGLSAMLGATSVARSHDPGSWERATEKNRST